MVRPSTVSVGQAGSHLTWILRPWWSPATQYQWVTTLAPHVHAEAPAAVSNSKGSCTRAPTVNSGYNAATSSLVNYLGFGRGRVLGCAVALRFCELGVVGPWAAHSGVLRLAPLSEGAPPPKQEGNSFFSSCYIVHAQRHLLAR